MSMLATFIQVQPSVLERLGEDTGIAERLFAPR
jgi:hypothetical protein